MAYYPYSGGSSQNQNTGYLGTPYTEAQVDAVPFLKDAISQAAPVNNYYSGNQGASLINSAMANPVAYVQSLLPLYTANAALGGQVSLDDIKQATSYLASNGVSTQDIQQEVNQGIQQAKTAQQGSGTFFGIGGTIGAILSNPEAVASLVAAAVIPGLAETMGPSIAASLTAATGATVSTAVGTGVATALLSTGAQVAAGVPVNQALQNAAVSSLVTTGSNEVANAIKNTSELPTQVINGVVSGAAGAVKTLAEGGSTADALRNAEAGVAASASASTAQELGASQTVATGIGGAVGGGTAAGGGTTGAIIGGLSGAASGAEASSAAQQAAQNKAAPPGEASYTPPEGQTSYTEIGKTPSTTTATKDTASTNALPPVTITARQLQDLGTFTPGGVSLSAFNAPSTTLQPVTISAPRDLGPTQLPDVNVIGTREQGADSPQTRALTPTPSTAGYDPGLFIYGGTSSPLSPGVQPIINALSSAKTGSTSPTTGGAPGGTELDPSTGKVPQLVWGDKYSSLREGLDI